MPSGRVVSDETDGVMTDTTDWALAYANLGWRVFPLWAGEKRPLYDGWPTGATTDPKLIHQYWDASPDRNMGVVCGEAFDAWDIEVQHLDQFNAWLKEQGHTLPESPLAQTGRGGWHYLTEPTGVNGSRNLYLDGTHIGELKSTGGFIVISPSITEAQYRWLWRTPKLAVQPAPDWLLTLLERPRSGPHKFATRITDVEQGIRRLEVLSTALRTAGPGKRNNYLYWAMRRALEEGIPARYAGAELLAVGKLIGLEDHEAKATIRSAFDAEGQS
jgi:hypothetical protein